MRLSIKNILSAIGLLVIIIFLILIYRIPQTYSFSLPSIPPVPSFDRIRPAPPRRITATPTVTVTPSPSVTATLTPIPSASPIPLPRSLKEFTVSGGTRPGPKFTRGFLDPYGPLVLDRQKISVTAFFDTAITTLNATVITDNNSVTIPLMLTLGSDTFGTWEGTWQVEDTTNNKYKIIFTAASGIQTSQLEINLR